ncbi:hypothetical protein MBT84_23375 [Streptomyces sp. MBT84]|nr:hypothetical protein [Streptomyces sp. MBT84]
MAPHTTGIACFSLTSYVNSVFRDDHEVSDI